ncbi:MAG TPA: sensor domain-containing protein [Roseiflexaceae bacterium]|nr:sensor domain-containing protein [Roseiflexaceae bacterium]
MYIREHTTMDYQTENSIQSRPSRSQHAATTASAWRYLLLSMPIGVLSFAVLLIGLTLGLPLLLLWVGIPVLLLFAASVSRLVDLEADLAGRYLGLEPLPRMEPPAGVGGAKRLLWLAGQGGFWGNLGFLLLKAPLGLLSFIVALVLPCTALALVLMPLAYPISQTYGFQLVHIEGVWTVDSWPRAFICSGIGVLLGVLSLWVFDVLASMWRGLARRLLRPFSDAPYS